MLKPLNHIHRRITLTFLLVLLGFLSASPHAWAQG
jgi:hypothetical protein